MLSFGVATGGMRGVGKQRFWDCLVVGRRFAMVREQVMMRGCTG